MPSREFRCAAEIARRWILVLGEGLRRGRYRSSPLRAIFDRESSGVPVSKISTVLGIETSCDETAAAVVRGRAPGPGEILSNVVAGQDAEHTPYGGVVPEIAARAHVDLLDRVVERALADAGVTLAELDGIAVTAGPGLIGGVAVGLTFAKAIAMAAGKPLVALNHLEAHALTARLTAGVAFPFLLLLVSGGHCQLLICEGVGRFERLGHDDRRCSRRGVRQDGQVAGAWISGRPRDRAGGGVPAIRSGIVSRGRCSMQTGSISRFPD